MTQYPKISIVVPSYNQAGFLENNLQSILCQHYPSVEILVLDGGSRDGSVAIIERYAPHLAYWRSHPDGGQAAAIAEGLGLATGDICAFLNSDDMLSGGSLWTVARIFAENPDVNWLVGDTCLIDEYTRPYRYLREPYISLKWQIFVRNCIPQPSVFWRKSFYDLNAAIDPSLKFCLDPDLFFQFWKKSDPKMVRTLLSYQRHHAHTKTAMLRHIQQQEYPAVLAKYFKARSHSSAAAKFIWRGHRIAVKLVRLYYLHGVVMGLPRARRDLAALVAGVCEPINRVVPH